MSAELLTHDNPLLSGVTNPVENAFSPSAVNCTEALDPDVALYVRNSLAGNTKRAYLSDIAAFEVWGGRIPPSPDSVARYLASNADSLKVSALVRRLASRSKAHKSRGLPNPTRAEIVTPTIRGIRRTNG